jgi:hypothetical protein
MLAEMVGTTRSRVSSFMNKFRKLGSGVYVFASNSQRHDKPGRLPRYQEARKRDHLYIVVGAVRHARKPIPSPNPRWLTIPERGLFTGIAIFGAVGTGKTSCCMYPFAEQLIANQAHDRAKRIGGLVLEVKGDFCTKVHGILKQSKREAGNTLPHHAPVPPANVTVLITT